MDSINMSKTEKRIEEETEDFLTVDNPIPGQKFVCLSFVSPEAVIAQKNDYYAYNFYAHQMECLKELVGDIVTDEDTKTKLNDLFGTLDLTSVVNASRAQKGIAFNENQSFHSNPYSSEDEFNKYRVCLDSYKYTDSARMDEEFDEMVDLQTSVRGVKVRGCFESFKEAKLRAKALQNKEPNFHVWVGPVGYWLPFDGNPDKVEEQEYKEGELNQIVKEYKLNEQKRETFQEKRIEEERKISIEKAKAKQSVKIEQTPVVETNEVPTETVSVNLLEEMLKKSRATLETPNKNIKKSSEQHDDDDDESGDLNGLGDEDPWLARKLGKNL